MKVRCIHNTGEALRPFEYEIIDDKNVFGRFGVSAFGAYDSIKIGVNYLVMGLLVFESYQGYLIDVNGSVSAYPCQLFEVIDARISSNWYFRLVEKEEDIYPFVQSVFGYYELCFNKKSYENLIIEGDEEAKRVYFIRKLELENELNIAGDH